MHPFMAHFFKPIANQEPPNHHRRVNCHWRWKRFTKLTQNVQNFRLVTWTIKPLSSKNRIRALLILTQPQLKTWKRRSKYAPKYWRVTFTRQHKPHFKQQSPHWIYNAIQIRQPLLARVYQLSFDRDDAMQVYETPQ
jgi:hypothetical protein